MCVKGKRNVEHIEMTANKRHPSGKHTLYTLAPYEIYMTRSKLKAYPASANSMGARVLSVYHLC